MPQPYLTPQKINSVLEAFSKQGVPARYSGHVFSWDEFEIHHPWLRLRIEHPVTRVDIRRAYLYDIREGVSNARHLHPLPPPNPAQGWGGRGWILELVQVASKIQEVREAKSEGWKILQSFPKFEISDKGEVRNRYTGKIRKYQLRQGQPYMSLSEGSHHIARYVAAFVLEAWGTGQPSPGATIKYKDGNPCNLHIANLSWDVPVVTAAPIKAVQIVVDQWKPISEFPNYQISPDGRVRNSKGRLLTINNNGVVILMGPEKPVSRSVKGLVSKAWPEGAPETEPIKALLRPTAAPKQEDPTGWKVIPTAPLYEASKEGQIRRIQSKKVLKNTFRKGTIEVSLSMRDKIYTKSVAGFILEAWGMKQPHPRCRVIYKDGDFTNLHLSNLSWKGLED